MVSPYDAEQNSGIFVERMQDITYTLPEEHHFISRLGMKRYELVNHLGNVQAVISDRALPHNNGGTIDYYTADLLSATDYYPFGMTMAGRSLNTDDYRYGFNGKEFDQDWDGGGATYDYGFRIYDPRMCRFLSVDPLTDDYPSWSPYPFAMNRPIDGIDLDGLEYEHYSRLNKEEKKIFRDSPAKTSIIGMNAQTAEELTAKTFRRNGTDDISDAFRHSVWNALSTQDVGKDLTLSFTTAHEVGNDSELLDPKAYEMDMHNNAVGAAIGQKYPFATNEEIANEVLRAAYNGELKVIPNPDANNNEKTIRFSNKDDLTPQQQKTVESTSPPTESNSNPTPLELAPGGADWDTPSQNKER